MTRLSWSILFFVGLLLLGAWFVTKNIAMFSGQTYMSRTMYEHIGQRLKGESEESILQSAKDRIKMLALARQEGLLNDLSVQYALDDLVILELRKRLDEQKSESPPEEELKAFFEKNVEKYRKTEQRRVAVLRRELSPENDDSEFSMALKNFEASLLGGKYNPGHGFGQLASRYSSHRRSRLAGGDLGWLSNSSDRDLPEEVSQAVWAIPDKQEISKVALKDAVWYVILSDRREAELPEFRLVKKRVLYDYFLEQRDINDQHWKAKWSVLPVHSIPEL